jgi:hypothetical protein
MMGTRVERGGTTRKGRTLSLQRHDRPFSFFAQAKRSRLLTRRGIEEVQEKDGARIPKGGSESCTLTVNEWRERPANGLNYGNSHNDRIGVDFGIRIPH